MEPGLSWVAGGSAELGPGWKLVVPWNMHLARKLVFLWNLDQAG